MEHGPDLLELCVLLEDHGEVYGGVEDENWSICLQLRGKEQNGFFKIIHLEIEVSCGQRDIRVLLYVAVDFTNGAQKTLIGVSVVRNDLLLCELAIIHVLSRHNSLL